MDYTGTRREARESESSQFFRDIGEAMISHIHPTSREPSSAEVISRWRLGGYRLASFLVPMKKKRFPTELNALLAGMHQRMTEYEMEHLGPSASVEPFDMDASDKIEARATKFMNLATHPNTGPDEARNAALGLAKMIASAELAVLSWERVRHFVQRFEQMSQLFAVIRQENPTLFVYGAREQNH
jgi:hypothetical protein